MKTERVTRWRRGSQELLALPARPLSFSLCGWTESFPLQGRQNHLQQNHFSVAGLELFLEANRHSCKEESSSPRPEDQRGGVVAQALRCADSNAVLQATGGSREGCGAIKFVGLVMLTRGELIAQASRCAEGPSYCGLGFGAGAGRRDCSGLTLR